MLLETVQKFSVDTEIEAKDMIESFRTKSSEGKYTIKKASYSRKDKKAKGEIIATKFVVEITQSFAGVWDELE